MIYFDSFEDILAIKKKYTTIELNRIAFNASIVAANLIPKQYNETIYIQNAFEFCDYKCSVSIVYSAFYSNFY